jgi:hypothetical protein
MEKAPEGPVKIELPFDEAIRRVLRVKPQRRVVQPKAMPKAKRKPKAKR